MSDFDKMEPMVNKAIKSDGTVYEPYAKGTTLQSSSERNIEKYKRSSPFANKMINADGSVTEVDFSSGGGGGSIALPISSDDVNWLAPGDSTVTQTTANDYFNTSISEMKPQVDSNAYIINRFTKDDGDGATLIYVAVPGYPVMTLEQAMTLIASRLRAKVNIDDNLFRNLLDVGIVNGGEVLYKDEVTGEIISIDLFTTGVGGVDGSALIRHGVDTSFTLARNTPHQIEFTSTLSTLGNGSYFSKTLNGLTVDDSNKERSISYHVNLFTNGVFTYNVEVFDQNDNVIDSKEVTTTANDTTDVSFNYTYTSANDVDTYRLFITEIAGDYEGGYVTIGGTTTLGATVYTDGNLIIDPKYLPQEEYIPFETLPNLTLNATKQTLLSVSPFDKGIMQIKPGDLTSNLILNRSGGGTSVGYVNASIYLNGVEANTVSASFDSNRDGILLPLSNALKVVDYDTSQTLEVRVSYTSTPNGATIGAGTLEIAGGVASLTATPK